MDVEMEGHRYQKNPQDIKDVQRLEKKDKEGRTLRSLQFDVPNAISTICWYGLRYAGVFSQSVTTTFCCWLPLFRQKAWNFNSLR